MYEISQPARCANRLSLLDVAPKDWVNEKLPAGDAYPIGDAATMFFANDNADTFCPITKCSLY